MSVVSWEWMCVFVCVPICLLVIIPSHQSQPVTHEDWTLRWLILATCFTESHKNLSALGQRNADVICFICTKYAEKWHTGVLWFWDGVSDYFWWGVESFCGGGWMSGELKVGFICTKSSKEAFLWDQFFKNNIRPEHGRVLFKINHLLTTWVLSVTGFLLYSIWQ